MASKNYRYTKTGKKNPNYVKSTSSSAPATKEERRAAGRQRLWEAEKAEREKKNSLDYKKQQSSQVGWQKSISNAPNKQEQEKQRQKNREQGRMRRWEDTQKDAYKYDSQFTEDYFNNSRYNSILQSDFDSLDFKSKAEHMDLVRKAQAGWNYRSQFEGVDDKVNPTTEDLYDLNSGANAVRDISWIKGANEEDIRWLISDMEKRIENVGKTNKSRYRDDTQAELDAIKDYAKKTYAGFANEEMRNIGEEMNRLDMEYEAKQAKHSPTLNAETTKAINAVNGGYDVSDFVANSPELRKAVGYDELAKQYSDMDLDAELWFKINDMSSGATSDSEADAEEYEAYTTRRGELEQQLQEAQGYYANSLSGERYARMLQEAGFVDAGKAFRMGVPDYNAVSQTENTSTGMFGETITERGYEANDASLDQIVKAPVRAIAENAKLEAADAETSYNASLAKEMTPEEVDTYWGIRAKYGEAEAAAYFEWLKQNGTAERRAITQQEEAAEFATEHPFAASVGRIVGAPIAAIGGSAATLKGILNQDVKSTDPYFDVQRSINEIQSTVGENIAKKWDFELPVIGNVGSFMYNIAMSIGDMALATAVGGVTGGSAGTETVKKIVQAIMSSNAASSSMYESLERGEDPQVAGFTAAGIGAIEAITEKHSLDALFKDVNPDSFISGLKYLRNNILAEGSEEGFSDLLADGLDILLKQGEAQLLAKYKDYTANGYSGKDAFLRLAGETLGGYLQSFIAGGVTGAGMSGANLAMQASQQASADRSLGRQIQDKGNAAAVIRAALASADEKIRALGNRLASKIQEGGLPQDSETAAELQVVAEAEGLDANGQKTTPSAQEQVPPFEIKQPDNAAVPVQQPAEEAAPVAEEEPVAPVAEETGSTSEAEETPELEWNEPKAEQAAPAAEKVSPEEAKKAVTEVFKGSTRKLGKLYRKMMGALDVEISTKSVAEIKTAVQNRLKQLGENVIDPVADAIAKLASGEQMTSEELDILEASTVRQGVLNEVATSLIRNGGREYLSDDTVNLMERRSALQQATTAKNVAVAQKQTAAAPARVQEMVEETIAADEDGSIQARAQMLGNEEAAQTMIKMAEGVTNTRAYAAAFEAAYDYGTAGIDQRVASTSKETTALTPEQFQAAYQAGVKAAAAPVRAAKTGGKVTFAGNLGSRLNTLDGNQRAGINVLRKIASIGTVNVEFFESDIDENGNYSEKQGWYDPNTNTIHIDINAGRNNVNSTANFALLKVASHELTHYIKAQNASGYKALQDFVVKQLTANGTNTFDGLVALKMKQRKGISYEVAVEEVVADGCEMMLRDSTAIQQLAQENKGLFRRIRNWLRNFIASVKRAFRGVEATSAEARMIKDLEGLQKLWDDALVQAGRNVQQNANSFEITSNGVAVAADVAKVMDSDAYSPPDNGLFSIRETAAWAKSHSALYPNDTNFADNLALVQEFDRQVAASSVLRYLVPHGKIPKSKYGPLRNNVEYVYTFDMDTKCERTYQFLAYRDAIQKRINRQLTENEARCLIEQMRAYGQMIPCTYCYVEGKRMKLAELYMKYLKKNSESIMGASYSAEQVFDIVESARTIVSGYLDNRFNVSDNYELDTTLAGEGFEGYKDFMMPVNEEAAADEIFERYNITDKAAKRVIQGFVAEWVYNRRMDLPLNLVNGDADFRTDSINEKVLSFHDLATKAAQGGAKAKGIENYEPYVDQLHNISEDDKRYMVGMGGIRKHSSNDFQIQNVQDYMLFFMDLAADKRGNIDWTGHTYTKNLDYARIFAPTNDRINVSIAMYGDDATGIRPNTQEGVNWEELQEIRKQYKNVGAMAMVVNNDQLSFALNSNWIDMIIPFHASGMKRSLYYDVLAWTDYTSKQSERLYNKGQMIAKLRERGIKVSSSAKAADVKQLFTDTFNPKIVVNEKTGKPVAPHFFPGETVQHGVVIPGHNNDARRYFELCEEYATNPRFFGVKVKDANGNMIDVTQHPAYLKLIKETARTDSKQEPIVAKFDMDYVNEAIKGFRGYSNLSEDAYGIVDEFISEYIGKNRKVGWLTERAQTTREILLEMQQNELEQRRARATESMQAINEADKIRDSGVKYSTRADAEIESDIRNNSPYETGAGNIRYSKRVTDRDTLRFLDGQDYVVTYRSMQVLRGKLYPPMATEIEGRMEDASEVGVWEQAVEHPELIRFDKNGKAQFKLDKGVNDEGKSNGTDVVAAYNPYMHSSNLVLNDQFSAAWDRPNLVVVECHVPVSELTSGYHAQYAKDSVGWHSWHTGTVAGKLRKAKGIERQVLLSRYIKPVRILSYAEVAQQYAELLEGTDIEVPDNVVPPKLLEELKKHDVPIVESGKVKYSIRTDSLTDREILADAFENVAQNDTERSFLKNYRDKIADLQQKQAQLRDINKDIAKRKENTPKRANGHYAYDGETIRQMNRAKILRTQIDREDNAIIEMIKSKPLQDVLRRQKQRIEKQEAGKRREAIATIRDRKNATEVRHKIKAVLDDFNRRLKNPTEKSYIPANMVQLVIAAEELIDTRSGREGEKAQAKLAALQGMYERYKSDATFAYVYDPVIADMLGSLSNVVGNKSIYQLNSAELQSVYETLKALKKQVTEAVQLKAGNYARTIIEAGREMIRETQAAAPLAKGKAGEFLNWQLTPDKFFARLAGFKKNSIWSKVAESFSKGTEKMLEIQRDHYYHFKKFTESDEFDKLNDQKHLVDIGLTNDKGETVKVTRGMMLSAYMHLSNEENARGFMYGGFSIPNLKAYYDGKVKESYGRGSANTRGTAQELYELAQQMNDPSLTEEQLEALEAKHDQLIMEGMNRLEQMRNDIYSQMTQYEKDLVAAVRAWNDGKSQAYINDVTMDLYGIKKASVQNYFPIHRDTAFVNTDFASISRNVNLENWGSLKTRVPSQAPILLTDIAYEMDSSLNQMSRYVGYARAQRDFGKLYNVRMPGMSGSVKKAVSVKFGTGAGKLGVSGEQYIENYIGSITGSRQGQSGPLSLIRRNLVRSTMTLNLRVGFSQLSAIPKAAAEVGWDSMISGFANGGFKAIFSKSAREDLAKQNAWFWQRYRGEGGQREFADAKGGNDIISKAWNKMDDITRGKLLNWCQNFDVMSTVSMWSMAKAWARKHTNYAEGSAEFIEAANKKYTDILRNTQAMSTTSEQSDAARTPGDVLSMFTMFKSEAFANFNLLYDAVAKLRKYSADFKAGKNDVTKADVNAAKRHLAGAATSVIIGASLGNALLKLLINALTHSMDNYRDDEDEITLESTLASIGKEVASDTAGMVMLGGELYELFSAWVLKEKYYAPNDMALAELTEAFETLTKYFQDEDQTLDDLLNTSKKLAFNVTNMLGVPAENMKRYWKGAAAWLDEAQSGTLGSWEGGVTRTNSTNYDRLYNAAIAGDDAKFDRVLAELVENGKDEKSALSEFKTRVKNAYKNGEIDEGKAISLVMQKAGVSTNDAHWLMKEWNYTGEGEFSKYIDLDAALEKANASAAQAAIAELAKYGTKEDTIFKRISAMYNEGKATNLATLSIRANKLYTPKTPKNTKDDFDGLLRAIVDGGNISAEMQKVKNLGYSTKNIMTALNGAFGKSTDAYIYLMQQNPSEGKRLEERILDAYGLIGLDREEERAWIRENWIVSDTDE